MAIRLLIVLLIINIPAFSQSLITDSGVVYKRGIYKSLKEFRNNNPSLELEFKVEERSNLEAPDIPEAAIYYLAVPKNSIKKTDSVWGFCDGKEIYVTNEKIYNKNNKYYRLSYVGLFCIYSNLEITNMQSGNNPSNSQIYNGKTYRIKNNIFNINQGKHYELDKGMFSVIIDNDPELAKEFKDRKRGSDHFVEYIKRFCTKHNDQVKP